MQQGSDDGTGASAGGATRVASENHAGGGVRPLRPLRIALFGAAGDTGNLGVSALMHSILGGVARSARGSLITVFDNGWGLREVEARLNGVPFAYRRCGARLSRRYHRAESYANMHLASLFGGLWNIGSKTVLEADAVWDVSGGDSFGDLYGARHLRAILAPKLLALRHKKPLILLPQTYGPFRDDVSRRRAGEIARKSRLAWARDERSYAALRELAGAGFDPVRHRAGVDLAFALETHEPAHPLPEPIATWLLAGDRPLVGVNVSGLIHNDEEAPLKYGLTVDYRRLVRILLERLLGETEARIVLVPHVVPTEVQIESDLDAAVEVRLALGPEAEERVAVLPAGLDANETKSVLARLDWFSGTRMHSAIGALSSGVPTAGLAYSLKTRGVFESCGQGERVADLREGDADTALAAIWRCFEERDVIRRELAEQIPAVRARAEEELAQTLEVTAELAGA